VIVLLVEKLVGLRVDLDEQASGLDLAEYGESGYMLDVFTGPAPKLERDGSGRARREQDMREETALP